MLSEHQLLLFLQKIKDKAEFRDIPDIFIEEQLLHYLQKNPGLVRQLTANFHPRSATVKLAVKGVRAQLRRLTGMYYLNKDSQKVQQWLKEWNLAPISQRQNILEKILRVHASTRERLLFIREFYSRLFMVTGKPHSIIDLGCGLHPFALPLMGLSAVNYYAYDLHEEEVKLLRQFFVALGKERPSLHGQAELLNIFDEQQLREVPSADLCFLLKMTDVLDQGKGHKATERMISLIPARWIVVSFPTLTLSRKPMRYPRRRWMEWMCRRVGHKYTILEFPTEICYVLEKRG